MPRPGGNTRLKSARVAAGYPSQKALADAMNQAAPGLGIRGLNIGERQVRRWESENPPWPQPDHQRVLTELLRQPLDELGFVPPWGTEGPPVPSAGRPTRATPVPTSGHGHQPARTSGDFSAITRAHRHMYWSVAPATLHPAVLEHARLGCDLLPETDGASRRTLAAALAETWLLAGRIEFFDLRQVDEASDTLLRAFQAAGEADDTLLGSAVLAHTAFVPGWAGQREAATERLVAARAYARRSAASAEFWAWLDAVEAECETRCGNFRTALNLLGHAEDVLSDGAELASPEWLDWFSPVRLAAFKGNTQLRAGHLPQARDTLTGALGRLNSHEGKQRSVVLGDLAAVEAAAKEPEAACRYATQALDQLSRTWYATGMDRIREVRRALAPWQHEESVRELDDRLYDWNTTVSAITR